MNLDLMTVGILLDLMTWHAMQVLKRANQEIFMDQKRILQKIKVPNSAGKEGFGPFFLEVCGMFFWMFRILFWGCEVSSCFLACNFTRILPTSGFPLFFVKSTGHKSKHRGLALLSESSWNSWDFLIADSHFPLQQKCSSFVFLGDGGKSQTAIFAHRRNQQLGGGNSNILIFHPENWGFHDPIWRFAYFSNGWRKTTN